MSKIRIVIAEFEGDGDASLDFLAALRGALGEGADVVTLRQTVTGPADVPPVVLPKPAPVIHDPPRAAPAKPPEPAAARPVVARAPRAQRPRVHTNRGPDGGPSIASQIIDAFRVDQATTKADLAKRIYGNSLPESLQKLQSQIYMLTNTGRLNRLGMGRYEVVS